LSKETGLNNHRKDCAVELVSHNFIAPPLGKAILS
jgi:hypothetical protein